MCSLVHRRMGPFLWVMYSVWLEVLDDELVPDSVLDNILPIWLLKYLEDIAARSRKGVQPRACIDPIFETLNRCWKVFERTSQLVGTWKECGKHCDLAIAQLRHMHDCSPPRRVLSGSWTESLEAPRTDRHSVSTQCRWFLLDQRNVSKPDELLWIVRNLLPWLPGVFELLMSFLTTSNSDQLEHSLWSLIEFLVAGQTMWVPWWCCFCRWETSSMRIFVVLREWLEMYVSKCWLWQLLNTWCVYWSMKPAATVQSLSFNILSLAGSSVSDCLS